MAETVLTSDSMRKVVQEEGLEAKNLLNWNVSVNEKGSFEVPKSSKKPPLSPRPQSASPKPPLPSKDLETRTSKRCSSLRHPKSRVRSSSVGRNPEKGLRARYWAFLFENLYRAVDEIYQTCEMDESIVESKEAIMMLENYCKEFQALIQWLNISKNYEVTPPPNRPTSLAWEVRKSLPSKGLLKNAFLDKIGSGNGPKKKIDMLGDHIHKTTPIQTELESSVLENEPTSIINRKNSASEEKTVNFNLGSDQNLRVSTDMVNHAGADIVPCKKLIIPASRNNSNQTGLNGVSPNSTTSQNASHILDIDCIKKIPIKEERTEEKCEVGNLSKIATEGAVNALNNTECNADVLNSTDCNTTVLNCMDSNANVSNSTESNANVSNSTESNAKVSNSTESNAMKSNIEDSITTEDVLSIECINNDVDSIKLNGVESDDAIESSGKIISSRETKDVEIPLKDKMRDHHSMSPDDKLPPVSSEIHSSASNLDMESQALPSGVKALADGVHSELGKDTHLLLEKIETCDSYPNCNSTRSSENDDKVVTPTPDQLNTASIQVKTCEIGVQTVPSSSSVLNKNTNGPKPKSLTDAKSVLVNKKPVIGIQSSRTQSIGTQSSRTQSIGTQSSKTQGIGTPSSKTQSIGISSSKVQSKISPTAVSSQTSVQSSTTTVSPPTKEICKRVSLAPSRLSKPTVSSISAAKTVSNSSPLKPVVPKKVGVNGPTQELRPFRTGNYEPKIRCASHVVTPPITYRKFGNKKTSNPLVPSHMSRPSQHYIGKDSIKSGSTSSLSSTSSVQSWIGKGKGKTSDMNGEIKCDGNPENADDADGWETVRGRARCKNSPAKKLVASQNAIDTAIAAKLSQCKMGGFVYNCTSNSQPTKTSNVLPKVKPDKDLIENEESGHEVSAAKKTSLSSKPTHTSYLKAKTDTADKESKPIGSKIADEFSKNRKKVNSETMMTTAGKAKNGNICNDTKRVSQTTLLQRQLSTDNIKQGRIASKTTGLTKSHSSCSIDITKKESKQTQEKVLPEKKDLEKLHKPSSRLETQSNGTTESLPNDDSESEKQDTENNDDENLEASTTSGETSSLCNKEVESNLLLQKSEEISSNESSGLYEGLISDDPDGMISHDEAMTEAQELEMYEKMIAEEAQEHISSLGLSWGDQMDLLDMELRTPGRALQMHEKLSSPFRKRPLSETIRLHEEKQLKAQEQRERLLEEKAQHFKNLQKKVEEMKVLNEKKAERQRIILEQKLQKAEEKRKKQIEMIVRKAHDEEEKVNEIAFINSLEAQNKRHDLISKEKDYEARLHDIQEERQRKLEEKAAKEAAAEERRKVLEAERQARLLEMQEKRKQRDLKIEQQLMEKEKERQELANQKARERELRKSALNAAQQATVEELQKKIQLKQEESARRHEENMEQIRQKAFELSVRRYSSNNDDAPQLVPYATKKICTICNVLIGSEVYLLSHLRGKKHQAMIADQHQGHDPSTEELELYNLKHIVDASTDQLDPNIALDKERQKALKKRCKKLRQKLEKRGFEFEKSLPKRSPSASSAKRTRMKKIICDIRKLSTIQEIELCEESVLDGIEKVLSDLKAYFKKFSNEDKNDFCTLGGVNSLIDLINKMIIPSSNSNGLVPNNYFFRTTVLLFTVTECLFQGCYENCVYLLLSNKVGLAFDILSQRLNALIPDNFSQVLLGSSPSHSTTPPVDQLSAELMHFLAYVIDHLSHRDRTLAALAKTFCNDNDHNVNQRFETQITDIVSYAVSIGIVDRLSQYYNNVRGPIDEEPKIASFLHFSLSFLTALMKLCYNSYDSTLERKKMEDTTQFIATLKVTELVGAVSLLYCILLHDGSSPVQENTPPELPIQTIIVACAALRLLNQAAVINLHLVQSILGSEGLSLQLRHIASYILWYCSHWKDERLLHELILLLGYFTVSNLDNQVLIQAGQCPTVLQQLCALPFSYFSNPKQTEVLFPTLLACSYNNECNKEVLQQEMAMELLSTYLETKILDGYSMNQVKTDPDLRWCLHTRFPKYHWSSAKLYFLK